MVGDTKPIAVRMPLADIAKLDHMAERTGRTRAQVVRRLVHLAEDTAQEDIRVAPDAEKDNAA
jgi:predicted DNA-binding protein